MNKEKVLSAIEMCTTQMISKTLVVMIGIIIASVRNHTHVTLEALGVKLLKEGVDSRSKKMKRIGLLDTTEN